MRGATRFLGSFSGRNIISIHAPHAGSDTPWSAASFSMVAFQSTLPMRGATNAYFLSRQYTEFQSTLPMRGATHWENMDTAAAGFQSTLPMRGATREAGGQRRNGCISIHAPHAGSDDGG